MYRYFYYGRGVPASDIKNDGFGGNEYLKNKLFKRNSEGKFMKHDLPMQVQFSPVFSILSLDFNRDGHKDLLMGGNINQARLRFGKYDANYGTLLQGNGTGEFTYVPQIQSGFNLSGDVRSMLMIEDKVLIGVNQKGVMVYKNQER